MSYGRDANFALTTQLRQWAAQEIAADRLLPWLAVAYGFGVVIYFTAEREPAWWAAAALAARLRRRRRAAAPASGRFRRRRFLFSPIAAGFAAATVKTAMIEHPVLHYPASGVTIAGFVELREESQHTDRFVLRVDRIDGNRIDDKPQRVRLSVKRGLAPPAGSFVEVKAMLDPPLQPLAPGSLRFRPRSLFPADRRLRLRARRGQCDHAAGDGRPRVTRRRRGAAHARRHRRPCPRRAAGRHRRDRGDAAQRQARRDLGESLQRLVHFRRRPRAVDLRLSHGGRRRRGVFHHPRACWR